MMKITDRYLWVKNEVKISTINYRHPFYNDDDIKRHFSFKYKNHLIYKHVDTLVINGDMKHKIINLHSLEIINPTNLFNVQETIPYLNITNPMSLRYLPLHIQDLSLTINSKMNVSELKYLFYSEIEFFQLQDISNFNTPLIQFIHDNINPKPENIPRIIKELKTFG